MKVIYKYELRMTARQRLILPGGSQILSVCEQHNKVVLYARVERNAVHDDKYSVLLQYTGDCAEYTVDHTFIGTVLLNEGALVLHIFAQLIPDK